MNKAPIIIVIGPVGSGKGTQVALLTEQFGIPAVSAGDLFRAEAEKPTELGTRVNTILKAGELMPIDLWVEVVGSYIDSADFSKGYMLDGVLRTLEQADRFNDLIKERNLSEPWALEITLEDSIAMERLLKRGRSDTDTEEATRKRLEWSRTQTQPVIERYRELGNIVSVDGNQSVEKVHEDIVSGLTQAGLLE